MPDNLIATRSHRIHAARAGQLTNNLLAWKGGRPYIDARLHRAPNESDLSWDGDSSVGLTGRKNRAYLVNDAGRISQKITQYLFGKDAEREGIDPAFSTDVTTTKLTIRSFWEMVSEEFTAGQWVWLQADRGAPEIDPATGTIMPRSRAQKRQSGDRVYWNIWTSIEVVDWCFDANGRLLWLLTAEALYENSDPFKDSKLTQIRTLWQAQATGCTFTRYKLDKDLTVLESGSISIPDVPFVLLGSPSTDPWWFDDVEMIQGALLNLESLHYENLVKTVYPQLVIAETMLEKLQTNLFQRYGTDKGEKIVEIVKELIRGPDRPFVESSEDSGITRYLQPSAQDLKAIPDQQDRLRRQLFDMVGLALFNRETRQVQSAASKQFDHLDIEATLQNRSLLMQETEQHLIALSKRLDPDFVEYTATWPQTFSVPNTSEDVASLTQLANIAELPPSMSKRVLKTAVALLDDIDHIPPDERQTILDEIELMVSASGAAGGEVGKVPLAVQQLALARARAVESGDTALAQQLGDKIKTLLDTL